VSDAVDAARDLLEELARGLVSDPDAVSIEEFEEEDGAVLFELAVADQDYGKVIGRGGATIKALRRVVGAAARARAGTMRTRIMIDVVE
jgi:predicted RNA-binding protein YlqC (UPF0109 family)